MTDRLVSWLEETGWRIESRAKGRSPGVDVVAARADEKWLIEAKGTGKHYQARHNYFINVLGTLLSRMDDPDKKYSVAFPDLHQYRKHWQRLPQYIRNRIEVTALFVGAEGEIDEMA